MAVKYLAIDNSQIEEKSTIDTPSTPSTNDVGKIVSLNGSGKIDSDFIDSAGSGVNTQTIFLEAVGTIFANNLINLFSDGGVTKARLADASLNREAHGYIPTSASNVSDGAVGEIHFAAVANLSMGSNRWLGNNGQSVSTKPNVSGSLVQRVVQRVGSANGTMMFRPNEGYVI